MLKQYPELNERQEVSLFFDTQSNIALYKDTTKDIQHVLNYLLLLPNDQPVFKEYALYAIKNYSNCLASGDAGICLEHEKDNRVRITCTCLMRDIVHEQARALSHDGMIDDANFMENLSLDTIDIGPICNGIWRTDVCCRRGTTGLAGPAGATGTTGATGAAGGGGMTGATGAHVGPTFIWADVGDFPGGTTFMKFGTNNPDATEVEAIILDAATAKNLFVKFSTGPSGPVTFTLRKNGVDSLLTLTTSAISATNTVNTVSFAVNDLIAMKVVKSVGVNAMDAVVGVTLK